MSENIQYSTFNIDRSIVEGIGEVEIHVQALGVSKEELKRCVAILTPEEFERARRYRFDRDRNRFIAARGGLRTVLGHCLSVKPEEVVFSYGPWGKPELGGAEASSGLRFNLSHSEDLALIAVSRGRELGVDVERLKLMSDADDLVARFFSRRESEAYRELAGHEKPEAFFNLWTRKEAWLKATGLGIGSGLNQVEVSFLAGEPARLWKLPEGWTDVERWRLLGWSPVRGYVAALAVAPEGEA